MDMQYSLFTKTSVPLEPKWNVLKIVFDWLDAKPVGYTFGPKEIQDHVEYVTCGDRRPQDGTVTRYIRDYNAQGGCITCTSRAKSRYTKDKKRRVL
jgi:hypothetical protein